MFKHFKNLVCCHRHFRVGSTINSKWLVKFHDVRQFSAVVGVSHFDATSDNELVDVGNADSLACLEEFDHDVCSSLCVVMGLVYNRSQPKIKTYRKIFTFACHHASAYTSYPCSVTSRIQSSNSAICSLPTLIIVSPIGSPSAKISSG